MMGISDTDNNSLSFGDDISIDAKENWGNEYRIVT